jgi:hypothetical protein
VSPPDAGQRLFNIADAATYLQGLGAKATTAYFVRTLILRGELVHLRIGRAYYVSREALERWIDQRQKRARA